MPQRGRHGHIHCYIVEGKDAGEAGYNATQIARAHYPEFDEIEPVRTEALQNGRKTID